METKTGFGSKDESHLPLPSRAKPTGDGRKFEKLLPSPWTHRFHSVSIEVSEMDALWEEMGVLKLKVKNILMSSQGIESTKKRILMIYLLVSLGLAYHFKEEINEILNESFDKIEEMMADEEDLYTVSIIFWVFRRYGHNISSDSFIRFKSDDGDFKESLMSDAKGMLSLYEASHCRGMKDYILDDALSFTSTHLKSFVASRTCPSHLSVRIRDALILSQHWNMEMLAPVKYISFYEQEKDHDEMLLRFSKVNFKLIQLQYLQELKSVTKWYAELEFEYKFPPYWRDSIVINHFISQSMCYEPQLSRERIMMIKYITTLEILDDTFDRYASLSEAESLASSLKRWAPDHTMDKQPEYLKHVLNVILGIFEELERELEPVGKSHNVTAAIEEYKIYVKANMDLARWALVNYVPSFDEYMEVGGLEYGNYVTLGAMYISMEKMAAKEAFEWLKSKPKIVEAIGVKGRLMNDQRGYKDDISRGNVTNAIRCYMKQYGVVEKEAFEELNKMVVEADKVINEEFLKTTGGVQSCILKAVMDLGRMTALLYNEDEGYTNPDPEGKVGEYMTSMFVDLIRL